MAGQYLTKGSQVYIEGRLQHRSYTGKDGVERKVTEVVGETMQFGRRAQGQGTPDSRPSASQAAPKESSPAEEIPTINLDEEQDEVKIEDVPF